MNSNLRFPEELIDKIRNNDWIQDCYYCKESYFMNYPFYIHSCSKCNKKFCLNCLKLVKNIGNLKSNIRYCVNCY